MSTPPVRIALVGLDHHYWAFSLAEAVMAQRDARLVAVADAHLERAQAVARQFGVERVTANPGEIIEDEGIDVIASFISVDRNPGVCIAAARSGKHILSVKPLARTLHEATEIVTAVREAGVVFLPGESTSRLAEQYRLIKQWISEGRLGRILTSTVIQHASLPQRWPGDSDPGWFADPGHAPGGGWIDHSIYHIDRLRWLLDDEVQQVRGELGRLKYPDLPVEDYGSSTIRFESGVLATMEITWIAPPRGGRIAWDLIGSEGAIAYDSLTGRLSLAGALSPFKGWIHTNPETTHSTGLDHLIACVRGEETPVATVDDAWRNLAACRAFYQAASTGTTVSPDRIAAGET